MNEEASGNTPAMETTDAVSEQPSEAALEEQQEESVTVSPGPVMNGAKPVEEKTPENSTESSESQKDESEEKEEQQEEAPTRIFGLRTTANREDQVMDFLGSRLQKTPDMGVYSVIRAHGMRGYIFVEAENRQSAEAAANRVPYARGILPNEIKYNEIEHLIEQVKVEYNIKKNDIVELISGPFKRENAKVTRIDRTKEEVVVELLNAAIPIPITVKMDTVKVIRRENEGEEE